tara:strand:- start:57 stop:578 length:522 start_codon:yes stop_codon:yes gene_type:complete
MSYRRYAGDRFAGPTGVPTSFPLDVADGAILVTSGDNSTDQALYVKVTGNWQQVVQTGVVMQNMTGVLVAKSETGIFQTVINTVHETGVTLNASTDSFVLTGVDSIYNIDGLNSGDVANAHNQQIQCYVGGVLQMPFNYSLSNALGGTGNPTVTFSENLFSGVNVDFVYSSTA